MERDWLDASGNRDSSFVSRQDLSCGQPGTCFVDPAGLEFTEIYMSLPRALGLKHVPLLLAEEGTLTNSVSSVIW